MINIARDIQPLIEKWLFKQKVITIYGARQVGKTTLARQLLQKFGTEQNYFNCDLLQTRQLLQQQDASLLKNVIGNAKFIVIDEAQRIENIGLILKIMHEANPDVQIVATGSSSFDLANKIKEPLTGRGLEFILYPFSLHELTQIYRIDELKAQLERLLIFGQYPEIVKASHENAKRLLDDIADKYLYKDILELESVKKSSIILKLLQLIALQIGNEVSQNEIATILNISRNTVEKYLNLLEKAFIIFRLKSFSRNLRNEIFSKEKIYFCDLGIRNSLIAQYNPLAIRNDKGALWENFCILERLKLREYHEIHSNVYFWRTHNKKEIDYIEEYDGILHAYEFKWSPQKQKIPKDFITAYPNNTFTQIDTENFWNFLL